MIRFLLSLHSFAMTILSVALFSSLAYCSVSIKADVSKNKIIIGDKIFYTVTVEHTPEEKIKIPQLASVLGEFEVKDYKIKGPKTMYLFNTFPFKKKTVVEYRYLITTFTTGEYKIPPFVVEYEVNGGTKAISSPEITITIEGVKRTDKDIDDVRDVKNPLKIPRGALFYILLFFVPLAIIAGAAGYYYYKYLKQGIFSDTDLNRPAHEVAFERLNKLKEMGLLNEGKIKEYYIILSEIIRKYLEHRFSIPVLDRTTNELYRELRDNAEIDKKNCTMVKDFLEESDLVKFAKFVPPEDVIAKDTESAQAIVEVTKINETLSPSPLPSPIRGKG